MFFLYETCKIFFLVFQAVITPSEVTDPTKDPVTGFIVLDIGPDGYINYKVSSLKKKNCLCLAFIRLLVVMCTHINITI